MSQTTQPKPSDKTAREKDFPAGVVARVIKANPSLAITGPSPEGDVQFSTGLKELGLSRAVLAGTKFCGTAFFVNLVGDLLVRKNLAQFAPLLVQVEPKDYDRMVNGYRHRHFGMQVDQNDVIHFTFHISLIQEILAEDLEGVFHL